jgi:uncharacterized GH25 family protein
MMLTNMRRLHALGAALLLAALPRAHDCWLMPSNFRPAPKERVDVSVQVGVAWQGEEQVRNPDRIFRFARIDANGERPLPGFDRKAPAGLMNSTAAGPAIVVYQTNSAHIELQSDKFESYLVEEGLERIAEERAKRGEAGKLALEDYKRCAKALVCVGGEGGEAFTKPVGLDLELVPLVDPHAAREGGKLAVQLLFDGKPLEGALVVAQPKSAPDKLQKLRSDAQGKVEFSGIGADVWLVKAVHMHRSKRPPAQWQSYWAALTFELPAAAARAEK